MSVLISTSVLNRFLTLDSNFKQMLHNFNLSIFVIGVQISVFNPLLKPPGLWIGWPAHYILYRTGSGN